METKELMDLAAEGIRGSRREKRRNMATINIPVQFTGVVTVQVPDRLSPSRRHAVGHEVGSWPASWRLVKILTPPKTMPVTDYSAMKSPPSSLEDGRDRLGPH